MLRSISALLGGSEEEGRGKPDTASSINGGSRLGFPWISARHPNGSEVARHGGSKHRRTAARPGPGKAPTSSKWYILPVDT